MLDNVEIRVEPENLFDKASEVSVKVKDLKAAFEQINTLVEGTKSYWAGEAGDAHREIYKSQKDTIDQMLLRLSKHPEDLRLIAQNSMDTEIVNINIAAELPGDVIV